MSRQHRTSKLGNFINGIESTDSIHVLSLQKVHFYNNLQNRSNKLQKKLIININKNIKDKAYKLKQLTK